MKRRTRSSRSGFTLVELLLVVVIIGILAAIVIPKLTGRTEQAEVASAEMQITNIMNALDHYERDVGRFPATLDDLMRLPALPNPDRWKGPYLRANEQPKDPWGNFFVYVYPGPTGPNDFDLYSAGPDGVAGSGDDVRRK
jgi:general secretion pathway protein G